MCDPCVSSCYDLSRDCRDACVPEDEPCERRCLTDVNNCIINSCVLGGSCCNIVCKPAQAQAQNRLSSCQSCKSDCFAAKAECYFNHCIPGEPGYEDCKTDCDFHESLCRLETCYGGGHGCEEVDACNVKNPRGYMNQTRVQQQPRTIQVAQYGMRQNAPLRRQQYGMQSQYPVPRNAQRYTYLQQAQQDKLRF